MNKLSTCASALALALPAAALAEPNSCIVSAGSETYVRPTAYSTPAAIALRTRVSASKVVTAKVETRKKVSTPAPIAYFSSTSPGGVIVVR